MSEDLVKRLRSRCQVETIDGIERIEFEDTEALEAADRLQAQDKRIAELEAALVEVMDWIGSWTPNFIEDPGWSVTQGRVDAALGQAIS